MDVLSLHRSGRRADRARQVRDLLRAELVADVYPRGVLPDESRLMARYACTRNALRDALAVLTDEGLIERIPGAGTFASVKQHVNRHDHLEGLSEQLPGPGRVAVVPLEIRLTPAPAAVAAALELMPGDEVVYFERRLFLDGAPLSLWSSYLPAAIGGDLLAVDVEQEFYTLLEDRLGLRLGVGQVSIDAMVADQFVAPLLGCPEGAPILHLTRFVRRDNGDPVELGFVHIRGDRIRFVSQLERHREYRG